MEINNNPRVETRGLLYCGALSVMFGRAVRTYDAVRIRAHT